MHSTARPAPSDDANGTSAPHGGDDLSAMDERPTEAATVAGDDTTSSDSDDGPVTISPLQIVEALLFASDGPLPGAKVAQTLGAGDARDVRRHVAELNEKYERIGATFRVQEIAGGFQLMTLPLFHNWLARLNKARHETRLSPAALETLAVVAYKQPVTRADIESVRGVAAGEVVNRLRELDLVRIVGRAEDLGRPMLYGTTRRFLEIFGLSGLESLPKVDDVFAPAARRDASASDAPTDSANDIASAQLASSAPEGAGIDRPDDMPLPPNPEDSSDSELT